MMNKVFKIIDDIEKSDIKKRLDSIKKEIQSNEDIKKLIKDFNEKKELYEKYNLKDDFIAAKSKLLSNSIVREYINIQNEINLLSMEINKKLNDIKKGI
mgnify:CR=1 FL=1